MSPIDLTLPLEYDFPPEAKSTQKVEINALTRACQLAGHRSINIIYTMIMDKLLGMKHNFRML